MWENLAHEYIRKCLQLIIIGIVIVRRLKQMFELKKQYERDRDNLCKMLSVIVEPLYSQHQRICEN